MFLAAEVVCRNKAEPHGLFRTARQRAQNHDVWGTRKSKTNSEKPQGPANLLRNACAFAPGAGALGYKDPPFRKGGAPAKANGWPDGGTGQQ